MSRRRRGGVATPPRRRRRRRVTAAAGCDLKTGALTLDTENPGGVVGWGAEDESFEVREAISVNPDSSKTVKVRENAGAPWYQTRRGTPTWSWSRRRRGRSRRRRGVVASTPRAGRGDAAGLTRRRRGGGRVDDAAG